MSKHKYSIFISAREAEKKLAREADKAARIYYDERGARLYHKMRRALHVWRVAQTRTQLAYSDYLRITNGEWA